MPVPKPRKKETKAHFISRCISSLADTDSSRPSNQRAAMCYQSWRDRHKKKKSEEDGWWPWFKLFIKKF